MLKIKDEEFVDLKELERFIGVEIYSNGYKKTKFLITGVCINNYMQNECKRNVCFELDNGDDIINIEFCGMKNNEFVESEQLDKVVDLIERVEE